ncbi:MAG: DUF1214 domain-containing protein [Deltaproteobacteria bacterium]|nr:DUF1214 domain-containing protein [Deltaproteobacteria bacterium]
MTPADGSAGWETTRAWRELLQGLQELDARFLAGPKAVHGEQSVIEGYHFLATMIGLAMDIYLFSDPARPRFVDINTPWRRDRAWGGDNTDAYYAFAALDPNRTYRVSGTRGDSTYFSLTVYNEPEPGQWSNRIIGIVSDRDLAFDADGRFELMMGPSLPAGYTGRFITLTPDATAAVTRDYQIVPETGRRVVWEIESVDAPSSYRVRDQHTATALRTALRWITEQFNVVPIPVAALPDSDRVNEGHNPPVGTNLCAPPYQVPDAVFGWSARDACYSFGMYALHADEALVITHRPPACRFWNVNVWNPYMAGYNNDYERTSVNIGSARPNADGTVTVVIAQRRLAHPNAISTIGHSEGMIAFRWFHADAVPQPLTCEVVKAADAPSALS